MPAKSISHGEKPNLLSSPRGEKTQPKSFHCRSMKTLDTQRQDRSSYFAGEENKPLGRIDTRTEDARRYSEFKWREPERGEHTRDFSANLDLPAQENVGQNLAADLTSTSRESSEDLPFIRGLASPEEAAAVPRGDVELWIWFGWRGVTRTNTVSLDTCHLRTFAGGGTC